MSWLSCGEALLWADKQPKQRVGITLQRSFDFNFVPADPPHVSLEDVKILLKDSFRKQKSFWIEIARRTNMKILKAGMAVLTLHSLLAGGQEKRPDHGSAQKQLSRARPDLLPLLHKPMDGTVRVKNVGDGKAGSTKMTLDCVRLYMPSAMYSCPNLPIAAMGDYLDFAFPNNVTIQVPKLAPGKRSPTRYHFGTCQNGLKAPTSLLL